MKKSDRTGNWTDVFYLITSLRAILLGAFVIVLPLAGQGIAPKKLLIYYGFPSSINATFDVQLAAAEFGQYDYVVLGAGLEKTTHPDHQNTVDIITELHLNYPTGVFGYIDLGVTTNNFSLAEIQLRADEWLASGADGIFFDDFGYDFEVTRSRQNAAVDYVHSLGLPVIANGWVPADVFEAAVHPVYNPAGLPTSLNAGDYYLSESYQVAEGQYQAESTWYDKAVALKAFQDILNFKILSITTNDVADEYDAGKFFYAWYSALLFGHEATGWGEFSFSSNDAQAPFRQRPVVNPGNAFNGGVVNTSPVYARETDAGQIWIDAAVHTFGFDPIMITFVRSFTAGWQLVGLPNLPDNRHYQTIFPGGDVNTLFGYNGVYQPEDTLEAGQGYWLHFTDASQSTISGSPLNEVTISIQAGWNLITGLSCDIAFDDIDDPDEILLVGTLFKFEGTYQLADTLHQGFGYWVNAGSSGQITLTCPAGN